ncbi:MAG: hypothetical protein GY760_22470 [Deltaproteobacteria bacterium]|jgi:hypothetical protein|nr:hypothetical protein [Deltaproteobacteria bacterium]
MKNRDILKEVLDEYDSPAMILDDKIDNYIKWYREECNDPYGELRWLIECVLEDENNKKFMMEILNDTAEIYRLRDKIEITKHK